MSTQAISDEGGQKSVSLPSQPLVRSAAAASFVSPAALFVSLLLYFSSNLRDTFGAEAYALADLLLGPVWCASTISMYYALRQIIAQRARHRMSLALAAAVLAAGSMMLVACIRSANRQYHLRHPELHLEQNAAVLIIWTTMIAGLIRTAWNYLGWAQLLLASAGWTSGALPRPLCALYAASGIAGLFVYARSESEGAAVLLMLIASVWQGIFLVSYHASQQRRPNA